MFIEIFMISVIVSIRTLITTFPFLIMYHQNKYSRLITYQSISYISLIHFFLEGVLKHRYRSISNWSLLKLPFPNKLKSIFPNLALSEFNLLQTLSIVWIFVGIALFIALLCVSIFNDKVPSEKYVSIIPFWYNPLYWLLVSKTLSPTRSKDSRKKTEVPFFKPIKAYFLCAVLIVSSVFFIDYSYIHKDPTDIIGCLGTSKYTFPDRDFAVHYDSSVFFGAVDIDFECKYTSASAIDSISWHYAPGITPTVAWEAIHPIADRLTEAFGVPNEKASFLLLRDGALKHLEWTAQTTSGKTANIVLLMLPPNVNTLNQTTIELKYTQ